MVDVFDMFRRSKFQLNLAQLNIILDMFFKDIFVWVARD